MKEEKIKIKTGKDGYSHFYFRGKDVTGLWMDFFSGLTMKQESKCEELFIKKYSKKLANSRRD